MSNYRYRAEFEDGVVVVAEQAQSVVTTRMRGTRKERHRLEPRVREEFVERCGYVRWAVNDGQRRNLVGAPLRGRPRFTRAGAPTEWRPYSVALIAEGSGVVVGFIRSILVERNFAYAF